MKTRPNKAIERIVFALLFITGIYVHAQISPGIYKSKVSESEGSQITVHSLTVGADYIIHNAYRENPPEFIGSWGGYYGLSDNQVTVKFEFNSDFESDQRKEKEFSFKNDNNFVIDNTTYVKSETSDQALDGHWLFATRGPDTGQERRGDDRPRKTLKVLMDGHFQWIAYHTETFKFSGTGGGKYTAADGTYIEEIIFFSRDNSRVGAKLEFQYRIDGSDWHHTGKNSRGEPMYEIWSKR